MRIRVVLEIELDPENWQEVSGVERPEVQQSVKGYVLASVQGLAMLDEAEAEVSAK